MVQVGGAPLPDVMALIVNAACALGMDSFIMTSVNIFPELVQDLISAGKNGDMLNARKLQEKLSSAITAITKRSKYCLRI
ncbi:hypothetical protein DMN91_004985 [Ooceraea biroi]|uniref:Uncharacterized protein n=1 Tax=Ooceraea biroi TaxID=2015173 RepID=A0A3L8DQL1_OOCBI|nr:hypothetical protein DMN91_004985 [Ooceraea biroi]